MQEHPNPALLPSLLPRPPKRSHSPPTLPEKRQRTLLPTAFASLSLVEKAPPLLPRSHEQPPVTPPLQQGPMQAVPSVQTTPPTPIPPPDMAMFDIDPLDDDDDGIDEDIADADEEEEDTGLHTNGLFLPSALLGKLLPSPLPPELMERGILNPPSPTGQLVLYRSPESLGLRNLPGRRDERDVTPFLEATSGAQDGDGVHVDQEELWRQYKREAERVEGAGLGLGLRLDPEPPVQDEGDEDVSMELDEM